jgi:hypothetical protein
MEKIFEEMRDERVRQCDKGFDANHDDAHSLDELCDHVIAYAKRAKEMLKISSPEEFRRRIKQVGTIAVSTCESFDRRPKKK